MNVDPKEVIREFLFQDGFGEEVVDGFIDDLLARLAANNIELCQGRQDIEKAPIKYRSEEKQIFEIRNEHGHLGEGYPEVRPSGEIIWWGIDDEEKEPTHFRHIASPEPK